MDLNTVPLTPALPFPHKLPLELFDYVIDALADDRDPKTQALPEDTRRALINCALVCHNWRPRAEMHLRTGIFIDDVKSLTNMAQRMNAASTVLSPHVSNLFIRTQKNHRYPPGNIITFLPILFRLGLSSIHSLSFNEPFFHDSDELQSQGTEQKTVSFPYLSLHPLCLSLATPVFSTVRELRMHHMTFKNFSDFAKFLNCFTRLEELICLDVRWLALGVVPGCVTRKKGRTFLQSIHELQFQQINAYGINRILAALPEDQLSRFYFGFERNVELDVQEAVSDPVTGENAQISLARFTNLDRIYASASNIEQFKSLLPMFRSWKPTEAPSRYLSLHLSWRMIQSLLITGEGTGTLGWDISVLEENWGSAPPLTVKIIVENVGLGYKDKKEEILMKVKKLFPKPSEEGRLEVKLGFRDPPKDK